VHSILPIFLPVTTVRNGTTVLNEMQANLPVSVYICRLFCRWVILDREKQTALESWERKLQAIITGKSADNVVSITSAKGTRKAA
jgi:hypothetical protein